MANISIFCILRRQIKLIDKICEVPALKVAINIIYTKTMEEKQASRHRKQVLIGLRLDR